MAGIRTRPSALVSATADPEMPDMNVADATLLIASPPRNRPRIAFVNASRRSVIPPAVIRSPASRKKGMARSSRLSTPEITCCGTIIRLIPPTHMIAMTAAAIRLNATGTASSIRTATATSRISASATGG